MEVRDCLEGLPVGTVSFPVHDSTLWADFVVALTVEEGGYFRRSGGLCSKCQVSDLSAIRMGNPRKNSRILFDIMRLLLEVICI